MMKAEWYAWMMLDILGANLIAMPLDNNFPTLWIKLIGL